MEIEPELSKVKYYRSIAKLKGEGKRSILQFLPSLILSRLLHNFVFFTDL